MPLRKAHYSVLQVSNYWNNLALDGSNWQKVDLFEFQTFVEVSLKMFKYFLINLMLIK